MSLQELTRILLRKNRIIPRKSLGQNFVIEPAIFQKMSEYALLDQKDVTLDVGAGLGFLTRFLAERCRRVLAVEADDKLVQILREQLTAFPNAEIIKGNVLKVEIPGFGKIISIPPYQISTRLLLWLFNKDFEHATLVFQREFADRLVASVGTRNYGWLTILTYYFMECELLDKVPKQWFYPQPKVDSVIVHLNPKRSPPFALKNKTLFTQLTRSLFTQRNRKVRNSVMPFLKTTHQKGAQDAARLADTLPFHDKRVRELTPEDIGVLTDAIILQDHIL